MTFETRAMQPTDIPACVDIINHIISLGGTTAYEDPYTVETLTDGYLDDPRVSNVVLHNGRIVGFQAAFEVEPGIYSIGSFTDQKNPVRGSGAAMFAKTQADCRAFGGTAIIAKITSDNTGGLAFYAKMGFQPDTIVKGDLTRRDGTTVDRVIKRFTL